MTHDEAVNILKNYQLWRRGKPPYDFGQPVEMPFAPKELGQALDHAIAVLERPAAPGKAIDHSGDPTDMVTQ